MLSIAGVKQRIANYADVPVDTIKDETSFEDLNLDSLDAVALSMELEDDFGVKISDEEIFHWKTVKDVILYMEDAEKKK